MVLLTVTCNLCGTDDETAFYLSNRYTCKACLYARRKAWRAANPDAQRRINRQSELKRRYGIEDLAVYDQMLAAQDGCCAICKEPHRGRGEFLHVDHDHETGEVRGLLCSPCNLAIGLLKHDPDVLESAAAYLKVFVRDSSGAWSA